MSKNLIKLEAESLALGESKQIFCPYCDNAPPYGRSMSLTRTEQGVLFNCFRASCTARGRLTSRGVARRSDDSIVTLAKDWRYTGQILPLDEEHRPDVYRSSWEQENIGYNPYSGNLLFPVYSYNKEHIGYVNRSYDGRLPKTINYINPECNRIHFPLGSSVRGKSACMVEDIPSSIAVSEFLCCCALLGTTLTREIIEELQSHFETLYICLDRDARGKAIKWRRELRTLFKKVEIVLVDIDPKDMSDEQLKLTFGDLK